MDLLGNILGILGVVHKMTIQHLLTLTLKKDLKARHITTIFCSTQVSMYFEKLRPNGGGLRPILPTYILAEGFQYIVPIHSCGRESFFT